MKTKVEYREKKVNKRSASGASARALDGVREIMEQNTSLNVFTAVVSVPIDGGSEKSAVKSPLI